ncbi:Uncharacterised protein [Chromobacterium vaccinii]|nr:Uncharacterised protein [Chromobacterium vaccinii]
MVRDDANQQYAEACQAVANEYIERSTRFGVQDLAFKAVNARYLSFTIKVRHSLDVVSDAQDKPGLIKASEDGFLTRDWGWYQATVEEQAVTELQRPETREKLAHEVKTSRYAAISKRTCIRTHPRRLFHPYTCGTCHGSGEVTCHGCSGHGKVRCSGCGGTGDNICFSCGGSGRKSSTHQVRDSTGHYHSETRYHSCSSCRGGRVSCSGCGGRGQVTCRTCGGSGQVVCAACAGHGSMTKITETRTYTTPTFFGIYPKDKPSYLHDALSKLGFETLNEHGAVMFQRLERMDNECLIDFYFECTIPLCDLTVEVDGQTTQWVMLGRFPQIHDTGGILEVLLRNDQARLLSLGRSASRWLPWFHRKARPILKDVMASEVHQDIMAYQANGWAFSAIVEKVNRSVSEAYVQQITNGLLITNRMVSRWAMIKFILFVSIIAPAIFLATLMATERRRPYTMFASQEHLDIFTTQGWISYLTIGAVLAILAVLSVLINRWWHRRWLKKLAGNSS